MLRELIPTREIVTCDMCHKEITGDYRIFDIRGKPYDICMKCKERLFYSLEFLIGEAMIGIDYTIDEEEVEDA
jgi:hypothetical protein